MTKAQIIEFVNGLTRSKREFLTLYLTEEKEKFLSARALSRIDKEDKVLCPHCNSNMIVRYGRFNGKVRYKCKRCLKYFNKATGHELAHTRKGDVFQEYLSMLVNSVTIREAAEQLEVSQRTVFLWKHKIMSTFSYVDASGRERDAEKLPFKISV